MDSSAPGPTVERRRDGPTDDAGNPASAGPSNRRTGPQEEAAPERPRPFAVATRVVAIAVLGAGPVVARLLGHGPDGRLGAAIIAVLSLLLASMLCIDDLTPRHRLAAASFLVVVGELITVQWVGRAPIPLALAGIILAGWALTSQRPLTPAATRPHIRVFGTVTLALAGLAWLATGSLLLVVALQALAAVVLAVSPRIGPVDVLDRSLGAKAVAGSTRAAALLGAAGTAALRLASHETSRASKGLGRGTRALGRAITSLWRWVVHGIRRMLAPENRTALLVGVFIALIIGPVYPRFAEYPGVLFRGTSDIPGTIERAEWIRFWPLRMSVPHPGWSLLLLVFMPILGKAGAVAFILGVATGVAAATLVLLGRSRWDDRPPLRPAFAAWLGLGWVLMESPALFVPTSDSWWGRFSRSGELARGSSFAPLHVWPTPTITLSFAVVFVLVAWMLQAVRQTSIDHEDLPRNRRRLAILTIVSTLIQPATTLAFAPALLAYLVVTRQLTRSTFRTAMYFVVPGALIVLGQVVFLATNVSPWEQATWLWRPFWSWSHFGMDRPVFWAVLILPALCTWGGGRRYLTDPWVALSLLAFAISILPFLFLEQTTVADIPDGDLGVPFLMAMVMLSVGSLRFALQELQALWDARDPHGLRVTPWAATTSAWLALMLCAGVLEWAALADLAPAL